MRRPDRAIRPASGPGFTLVELLIVMVIIGIIIAFILNAAMEGVRRAEERQTQALIAKIDAGMADRVSALLATRADANDAHAFLASVWSSAAGRVASNSRAQAVARFDQIKAELPDVFVVQGPPPGLSSPGNYYPLNFAAYAYAPTGSTPFFAGDAGIHAAYFLPMGIGIVDAPSAPTPSFGANSGTTETTGAYGASYSAAAGLTKSLVAAAVNHGATPASPPNMGYDGVDNDADGLVDELDENGPSVATAIVTLLGNHKHKTARSEMLYALLVEGQGPFGSTFSPDDFNDSEVRDTDGDGLPEFVDAWGEPLQFYRWPIMYVSDLQKGPQPYGGAFVTRDQNPLDPNQQLVAPAWWSGSPNNAGPFGSTQGPLSGPAYTFQSFFFSLTDPNAPLSPAFGQLWDRGPINPSNVGSARREFFSRYLILSGGPDKLPGVPVLDPAYASGLTEYLYTAAAITTISQGATGFSNIPALMPYLQIESQAAKASPQRGGGSLDTVYYSIPQDAVTAAIAQAGNDDITSHNISAPGGATQ